MYNSKVFSRNEVNKGRQLEVDIVKILCIFVMIITHAMIFSLTEEGYDSALYNTMNTTLCALLGAPGFMFMMGLGLIYGKYRNNPNKIILRGLKIFILGYVLNIVRCFVEVFIVPPVLVGAVDWDYFLYYFLEIDIMQFAGLALIFYGLLRKIKLPIWGIFMLSIVLSIIGTLVIVPSTENLVGDSFIGLFIAPMDLTIESTIPVIAFERSPFPLLNYFFIVMSGVIFATYLIKVQNKLKFYTILAIITLPIVIISFSLCSYFAYSMFNLEAETPYYAISTLDAFMCIVATMMFVSVFGLLVIASKDKFEKVKHFITTTCSKLNTIYWIQWIVILWTLDFSDLTEHSLYYSMSATQGLLFGFIVILVSILAAYLITCLKNKVKDNYHKKLNHKKA